MNTTTSPFDQVRFAVRISFAAVILGLVMLADRGCQRLIVHATPTTIADENRTKPGALDWDITAAGDPDIQGFATGISVNVGEVVRFKFSYGESACPLNSFKATN